MRPIKNALQAVFSACLLCGSLSSEPLEPQAKGISFQERAAMELDHIAAILVERYAPYQRKKELFAWDLAKELQKAKAELSLQRDLSLKEKQRIVSRFLNTTGDYHVNVQFYSTEEARLPFKIIQAEGAYYITSIDRSRLPQASYPIQEGDQILAFNERPIEEEIEAMRTAKGWAQNFPSAESTEAMLASLVTHRRACLGEEVPQGLLSIRVKQSDQKERDFYLVWEYFEEQILSYDPPIENRLRSKGDFFSDEMLVDLLAKVQRGPEVIPQLKKFFHQSLIHSSFSAINPEAASPWDMGARKSFIPPLGPMIWQSPEHFPYFAYIYQNEDKKLIGYLRIPHYQGSIGFARLFQEIIAKFQEVTDGLIIDQVNNPGGHLFHLYTLLSMLTDQPLETPHHRIMLSTDDLFLARLLLSLLDEMGTPEQAAGLIGLFTSPYPTNYQNVLLVKEYCRFVINQCEQGKKLSDPYYLLGVDQIQPHPTTRYTKPILLVTNEKDYSAADICPAILQDAKRAVLIGGRTAGAGGCVNYTSYPNSLGISHFTYTYTVALRKDNSFIENEGISPTIPLALTPNDFKQKCRPYANRINQEMKRLLQNP
ncbi:MAG: protease-like factor [Chlamydiales bacterium]|jgi:hypothetical protein|nr:protease-like factor [Chlamydiales bacterium]